LDYYTMITIAKAVYALFILGYFSILDYKYRDIPDKLVWGSLAGSAILLVLSLPDIAYQYSVLNTLVFDVTLFSSIFIMLVLTLMYFLKYMGGADVLVLLDLLLLFPLYGGYRITVLGRSCSIHLSPIIVILLYASLTLLAIILLRGIWNIVRYWRLMPGEAGLALKTALAFIGRPVKISEYLKMKHYYPLELIEVRDEHVTRRIRLSFSIEEEYYEHQETIRSLLEKGLISGDDYIWVTLGIPFLVPLLFGFIGFILAGDYPLTLLLGVC
jgi:preflagellin peptidase FlaK